VSIRRGIGRDAALLKLRMTLDSRLLPVTARAG
jgi:hypothetical protein